MREYAKGFVTKDRGVWRAVVKYKCDDGTGHRMTKSTGIKCSMKKGDNRGKSYAEQFLREWRDSLVREEKECEEVERLREEEERRQVEEISLVDYCRQYISLLHVKETTMTGYRAGLRKMMGTPMGEKPIGKVCADDVRRWEQGMREDGLSETTISHYHALLAQVMKNALIEERIDKNPLLGMKAPRRKFKPVNSLNAAQRMAILKHTEGMDNHCLGLAIRIALLTGMRRAEICALRWQDVDLDGRVIHVVHSLTKGHGFKLDTPKDPAGGDTKRHIPIGGILEGYLRTHRSEQRQELAELGVRWTESLFVLGNPLTGEFLNPETLGREWHMLVRAMGWRGSQGEYVRFHDLRHTFATLAISEKVMDVMALSRILGHRDASMTLNVYADALEETKRSGMEALDGMLLGLAAEEERPRRRAKHMRVTDRDVA